MDFEPTTIAIPVQQNTLDVLKHYASVVGIPGNNGGVEFANLLFSALTQEYQRHSFAIKNEQSLVETPATRLVYLVMQMVAELKQTTGSNKRPFGIVTFCFQPNNVSNRSKKKKNTCRKSF